MIRCPLANTTDVELVEEIPSGHVVALYSMYGIDTRSIFEKTPRLHKYRSMSTGYEFYYPFDLQGGASLYEKLEEFNWYYQEGKWEHHHALNHIKEHDRVLEIGCGRGAFLKMLKQKNAVPVGIELNEKAVLQAQKDELDVMAEDLAVFSGRNHERFDVVCFFQVLEHIADPGKFLKHALLCLKPGGVMIVAVPNSESLLNNDRENALNFPPHHMGLWSERSLNSLARIFRLRVEEIRSEPLQKEHVEWYSRLRLKLMFGGWFYYRVIRKTILPKLHIRYVKKSAHAIVGHTIVGVFRK